MVHGQAGQTYGIAQAGTKNKQLSFNASPKQRGATPVEASHSSFSQHCDPRIQSGAYQSWPSMQALDEPWVEESRLQSLLVRLGLTLGRHFQLGEMKPTIDGFLKAAL